jgi:site-specific recombinase XerD
MAMAGVPLQVIAEVLGHSDTRITEKHYAHLSPSYVADTVRAHLPNFGSGVQSAVVPLRRSTS